MSSSFAPALLLLFCASAALAEPVAFPALTAEERQLLERRGVVIRERTPTDNRGIGAESMALVEAPTSEVWPVVRDCEHFSRFMPNTKASARKEENGESLCFDEIALPFPLPNLWADTRSKVTEEPQGHFMRAWSLVRGNYNRDSGAWKVLPWGPEGKQSLVVYVIDSDPAMVLPDAILRAAQTGSLPEVFKAIRKRVYSLRAAAPATPTASTAQR
jgi:ribosome-associated toxin RatA of RatAB toxin-antitoxin module